VYPDFGGRAGDGISISRLHANARTTLCLMAPVMGCSQEQPDSVSVALVSFRRHTERSQRPYEVHAGVITFLIALTRISLYSLHRSR